MSSCRASRASHVVFYLDSLPRWSWQHLAGSTTPRLLQTAETRERHTLPKAGGPVEKSSLTFPNPRSKHQAPSSVVCASSSRSFVCPCPRESLHHGRVAFVYRDPKGTLALGILRDNQFKAGRPCALVRMSLSTTAAWPLCTATKQTPLGTSLRFVLISQHS